MIRYLTHTQIDKKKWDNCIATSGNGLIYGWSWYLDIVSPGWEALVEDDYLSVMPLTCRKKYGIHYLYQPPFTQQEGVFSGKEMSAALVDSFLESIPPHFKLVEIFLNTANRPAVKGFRIIENLTHEVDLNFSYETIQKKYSDNNKRNLKKGLREEFAVEKNTRTEEIIRLFRKYRGKDINTLASPDYKCLVQLVKTAAAKRMSQNFGIRNSSGELMAGAVFLQSHGKAIFLFSAANDEAKKKGAMTVLIDTFIREHSGRELILDFEGSNDKNLARFYKGFGAEECVYLQVKKNSLPAPIKWIKR